MQEKKSNFKKKRHITTRITKSKVKQNASKYGKMAPKAIQNNHNSKENSRTKFAFLKTSQKAPNKVEYHKKK